MTISDEYLGKLITYTGILGYGYYTCWLLILPFIDNDHIFLTYFPSQGLAIAIPVVLLVLVITVSGIFVSVLLINDNELIGPDSQSDGCFSRQVHTEQAILPRH